ncbi:isopeptide-forming domain-containing fimbrial protein [Anaeromassilibacillus senegalensis]|uniref:Isopeptide-forming domain-containing fimbrial protein n=1 Tax=Anaeromassilibacillus senegalensis TaxID=1673717 RepID=A0ABS9MKR9_9FIRM|nr:SpaA isopeptide-forming pilin-related protein [Anaeromassilibacillus senegalensis]MCG4611412.1 isopeptide-forming domain-containing fimbrial protein [Anaeromassilibacillus senegalensis]
MKIKLSKRFLSGFVALIMVLSLLPTSVFAFEADNAAKTITVTDEADTVNEIQEAINYINEQEDKTGWTINIESGTYNRFVVVNELDGLTIQAAEDADVTVETLNGEALEGFTFGGGAPDMGGIQLLHANDVTLRGLNIVVVDNAANKTSHMSAGISNHSQMIEFADNFTIEDCHFTGTNDMSGQGNGNVAISIGSFESFTITNCTFEGFEEAIRGQSDNANVSNAVIDGNQFINCNFAVHEYAGESDASSQGTYSFTNNTVTGTPELYNKAYFEDLYQDANRVECNGYTIVIENNTFTNAIVGLVNLEDNNGSYEDVYEDGANNTFGDNTFVVSGSKVSGQIEMHANYVAPEDSNGYWKWTGKENLEGGGNPSDAAERVQEAIDKANAEGSKTLTFGVDNPDDFLLTFTWFKDAVYWVSGDKTSYPGLEKWIVLENGTEVEADTAAAGDEVDFKLESNVPQDLLNYLEPDPADPPQVAVNAIEPNSGTYPLTFHDNMDEAFENPTNFVVKVGDTELTEDQYTLVTAGLTDGCDFEVTVDLAALYEAGLISEDDLGVTPVTVTYTATLKEGTTAGDYYNTAWVSYPNSETEQDKVKVETFKIDVFKYDQADEKGLAGAEFALYDETAIDQDGNLIEGATPVLEGIVSGEDGHVVIDGLDAGKYALVETKAPDNYVKSDTPLMLTIEAGIEPNVVNVKFANSKIPHTGGMGTTLFTIGGVVLLAAAGTLFVVSRRKQQHS